ncbi:hypothetical protein BC936DRAFT_140725 [Jimgerdemannia flammicorona]|uniref:Uncharacterized protein n=1 Tax=Jimgerdemannia flammicorona TaxID=994334 RepID=A0A433ACF8_9FUNG|nr:hypothetical protein BC936DRAFT_140725 [Jimgerdemannia flammicorona]
MSRPAGMPVHLDDDDEDEHGGGGDGGNGGAVHRQVLENVIEDCLAEFRVGLHGDIVNMHLELLRQFHIQKVILSGEG